MSTANACPDLSCLQTLLAGQLAPGEQEAVIRHVETCATCQQGLDSLTPASRSWEDVAAQLQKGDPAPAPGLRQVIEQAKAAGTDNTEVEEESTPHRDDPPGDETQAEARSAPRDEDLAFLGPPTRQGAIGRLGHYDILAVIGKGGFGTVLKAFDAKLHRMVAIKVLSPELSASGTARQRFIREARAAAAVTHEHLVTIHAVEEDQRPPYLVMQLIDGGTLQEKLEKSGMLGIKEILRIGLQMAAGLAAAHKQGLVHRDIKPANVLLENGVERVKITDFGLARAADDASLTQSGAVAGTPMYMSPEQANGETIDQRSDLFSLGSVLYVMCTGRPPFRANSTMAVMKRVIDDTPTPIRQVNPEIPEWLADIITKLHAKKPAGRYQAALEVAEVLGKHLACIQQPATQAAPAWSAVQPEHAEMTPTCAAPPRRLARRRLALLGAAAAGLLAVAAVIVWIFLQIPAQLSQPKEKVSFVVPGFGGPGWRQLWNGNDASGWIGMGDANWGRGDFLLFAGASKETKDKMPKYFHLRMEVNLFRGQGAVCFHGLPAAGKLLPPTDGWLVNFVENYADTGGEPDSKHPGRVDGRMFALSHGKLTGPETPVAAGVVQLRDWFFLEIIAQVEKADVLINGKKVMTLKDPGFPTAEGVLTLWNNSRRDPSRSREDPSIAFRNIEIKELPAITPPPVVEPRWSSSSTAKTPRAGSFRRLAQGKAIGTSIRYSANSSAGDRS